MAVLDAGRIARGVTGHTTAHITEVIDHPFGKLIDTFGVDGARLALAVHARRRRAHRGHRAPAEAVLRLRAGARLLVHGEPRTAWTPCARSRRPRAPSGSPPSWSKDVPLPFATAGGLRFDDQAQFHVRRYLLPQIARASRAAAATCSRTRWRSR